jgi:hypothetical protein
MFAAAVILVLLALLHFKVVSGVAAVVCFVVALLVGLTIKGGGPDDDLAGNVSGCIDSPGDGDGFFF